MNKKFLVTIFLFATIVLCSVSCFASNEDLGTEVKVSWNKTETTIQNAGQGVKNVAEDIGTGIRDMAQGMGNGIQDMFDGNNNTDNGTMTTNGNYNATRTSADIAGTGMSNTAWVWLILGITGIVIIALTWYYVSQDNTKSNMH